MHVDMARSVAPFYEVYESLAREGASERTL